MLRKVVRVLAWMYITYLALALILLMPAANFLAPWYVAENYGRELNADIILFNPFTLNAQVRGAALAELDGDEFAGLHRASVNLSLESLAGKGLVLDEVSLQGLRLHVRRTNTGTFNFSDLLPARDAAPSPEPGGELPALTIHRLAFTAEQITFTDEARDEPFSTHYEGIDIGVTELSTVAREGRPYRISAVAGSGGELLWEGTVSIPSAHSEGMLRISGLKLEPFWRFARPWLNFALHDGQVSIDGHYELAWDRQLDYTISDAGLELTSVDIQPDDPALLADTAVALERLSLSGIRLSASESTLQLNEVLVDGLEVHGWSEASEVSLTRLFEIHGLPAEESAPATTDGDGSGWQLGIADIRVQNSAVNWRSEYTDPSLMRVSAITAHAQAIAWPPQGDSPLSLQLTVNDDTAFEVDGSLALASGEGALDYALSGLPLTWFNPNLPEPLHAHISSGKLAVDGTLGLDNFLPLNLAMDGSISDFSGTMQGSEESITRLGELRWRQLQVDLEGRSVSMAELLVHDYEGRVHIAADGSVNASKIWQEEVGEKAGELAEELDLDQAWQVDLPEITIADSAIDFKDESLPIPFRTIIGDVNGELINLSSAPGATAKVDISGSVEGYAPVTLTGSAAPLGQPPALDLALTFTGVDLVSLTPYSGTYAGHAIERGLLNLNLAYSLENNHLKGENAVIIDQLKLGEKIDSDKALDLPLELALALLTDLNGVIDLKVPVEGSLDDPEFALGSVIAGAFVNLLTKAITAPFSLLGSLVGAEEDLQRIAFPAGSSEINEAAATTLGQLQGALAQRPGLTLVIRGQLNLEADRERLQRHALQQHLQAEGISPEEISRRGPAYVEAIDERYGTLGKDDTAAGFSSRHKAVIASIAIEDSQLRALRKARATAVKDHLVNGLGLHADRAVIEQSAVTEPASQVFSGVILDLQS